MESFGFMLFGVGFLLFVVNIIMRSEKEDYQRKLNEQREFGYQIPVEDRLHRKPKKSRTSPTT